MKQENFSYNAEKFDIPKDIDYIIIEMVSKADSNSYSQGVKKDINIERGLFVGMHSDSESLFVCVTTSSNDVILYNIDYYNICSIECGDELLKKIFIFTDSAEDYNDSVDLLGKLLEKFQRDNKVTEDKNLIDINKVKNYGVDRTLFDFEGRAKDDTTVGRRGSNMNGHHNNGFHNPHPPHNSGWRGSYGWYDDKEEWLSRCGGVNYGVQQANKGTAKPVVFKRKSTKPAKKKLETMMQAVLEVINNKGHMKEEEKEKFEEVDESYTNTNKTQTDDVGIDDDQDNYMRKVIGGQNNNVPI